MLTDEKFPIDVEALIPHRAPMRLVEELVEYTDGVGLVTARVKEGLPFLNDDGSLSGSGLVEMIAQAFAAVHGLLSSRSGEPVHRGYLVGIRKMDIAGGARLGDLLSIRTQEQARVSDFVIVQGRIDCEGAVLAQGSIKLWMIDE